MLNFKKTTGVAIILLLGLSAFCIPALVQAAPTEKAPESYKAYMDKILKTSGINDLLAEILNKKIPLGQSSNDFSQDNKANLVVQPWDFEDHTATHPSLPTLSDKEIIYQLEAMDAAFAEHNLPAPLHIAYPNGDYNQRVIDIVRQYRLTGRLASSEGRFPETYPIQNWYRLCTINMAASTTPEVVINAISMAMQVNGLVNIFTHSVTDPPDGEGTTPARLAEVLDFIKAQRDAGNLDVFTIRQAYTQYKGQKPAIVFSFDDSWYTDYAVVWPMFKARGLVGTSYITSYLVDLNDPMRLNWDQVCEMAQVSGPEPGWTISISSYPSFGGTTDPAGTLTVTDSLTITATPKPGYVFDHWVYDGEHLTRNPLFLPAEADGTSHTLTAVFLRTMDASVSTDRARYSKWSYVDFTATVLDGPSRSGLQDASVTASIYDTHGRLVWSDTKITDTLGKAKFTYKLVFNAQMGIYSIKITAEKFNYQTATTQTTFYSIG